MDREDSTEALQRFWVRILVDYVESKKTTAFSMATTKMIVLAHPTRPGTVQVKWDSRTGMLIIKQVHLEDPAIVRGEFTCACEALLEKCEMIKTVRLEAVAHLGYLAFLQQRGWKVTEPLAPYTNADFATSLIDKGPGIDTK